MATHIVKRGETLSQIAAKYSTTVSTLMSLNRTIKDANKINVGQVLNLPNSAPSKDYAAIGKQVEKTLAAIAALPEFKKLEGLM